MPKVSIPDISVCTHRGIHGKWIGRDMKMYAVCAMPLPYLKNCIELLSFSLSQVWPYKIVDRGSGNYSREPYTDAEVAHAEDQLRMLEGELKRRGKN